LINSLKERIVYYSNSKTLLFKNILYGDKNMNKSKGVKAVSLFVGILLCMALIQTAFAQSGTDAATGNEVLANATIDIQLHLQTK
jgi:hypothetical protein